MHVGWPGLRLTDDWPKTLGGLSLMPVFEWAHCGSVSGFLNFALDSIVKTHLFSSHNILVSPDLCEAFCFSPFIA